MTASEIAAMAESEQPHGHLVTQILGTKRELEISKEETVLEDQVTNFEKFQFSNLHQTNFRKDSGKVGTL